MPLFPETVRAQASGSHVIASLFVTFAFKSEPMRVWEGDGPISRDGFDWSGIGHRQDGNGNPLQQIDGLEQAINGTAPQLTLTLSGVDARVVAAARKDADADEIEGRLLTVAIGFFDATMPGLVPLDGLVPLGTCAADTTPFEFGRMDCSLWAADWVQQCTGVDLAADWRGQYGTRREYMRLLLAQGGLVRVAARAMERVGAALVPVETAQPGDIAIIVTEDGPALAIRGPSDWVAKTGDRLSHTPHASYAWRI